MNGTSAEFDTASASSKPLRVLVADDLPASQKLLESVLVACGHWVDIAENGIEAVYKVRNHDYDLVLMDINMPHMDGVQATAVIRRMPDPAKSRLPIVAITAFAWPRQRHQCLSAGMNGFLPKPLDAKLLMSTIRGMEGMTPAAGSDAPV